MPGPMEQKSDEQLRKERLHFYREEMSEINATLRGFLSRAKAASAFLVDKDGHLITREGMDERIDIDSICGLVAGAFADRRRILDRQRRHRVSFASTLGLGGPAWVERDRSEVRVLPQFARGADRSVAHGLAVAERDHALVV